MSLNGISSQICPGMAIPCKTSATVTKFTHHVSFGQWPYIKTFYSGAPFMCLFCQLPIMCFYFLLSVDLRLFKLSS